ncbi:hypothetical protein AB0D24_44480 [Streptomyces javensis]|uniref:hypothetical protein n=1 Tax=Streptomyces javensis TaxID=114698 RepID=UPI003410A6D6
MSDDPGARRLIGARDGGGGDRFRAASTVGGSQETAEEATAVAIEAAGALGLDEALLPRLLAPAGTALLFVSHDLPAVRALAEEAALCDGGPWVRRGPVAEILPAAWSGAPDSGAPSSSAPGSWPRRTRLLQRRRATALTTPSPSFLLTAAAATVVRGNEGDV